MTPPQASRRRCDVPPATNGPAPSLPRFRPHYPGAIIVSRPAKKRRIHRHHAKVSCRDMSKPEDLFSQPFVISRQRRDATVVIRGYVYQVNTTLLKWIGLELDQWLELEAGEDIDALQEAVTNPNQVDRVFEAVKCRERSLTLRSPE